MTLPLLMWTPSSRNQTASKLFFHFGFQEPMEAATWNSLTHSAKTSQFTCSCARRPSIFGKGKSSGSPNTGGWLWSLCIPITWIFQTAGKQTMSFLPLYMKNFYITSKITIQVSTGMDCHGKSLSTLSIMQSDD